MATVRSPPDPSQCTVMSTSMASESVVLATEPEVQLCADTPAVLSISKDPMAELVPALRMSNIIARLSVEADARIYGR